MYIYIPPQGRSQTIQEQLFFSDAKPCANCIGDFLACVQEPNCVRPKEIFILQDLLHEKCKRNCYLCHTLMLAKLKNATPAIGADHNIGPGPVLLLLSQENDLFEKVVLAIFWHGHCSQLKIKRPSWRYLQTERFLQVTEPTLFAYLGDLLLQCQWKVNQTNHIKQMLGLGLLLCDAL